MNYRKRTSAPSVRSTVSPRPSRPFLSVTITANVLFLASCGSSKTAAQGQARHQASTDVQAGVSVELTSREGPAVRESPELTLPVIAISTLPEGAEYSQQEGNTLVSAKKLKGDSVVIRATSLRTPVPEIDLKLNTQARSESADSTAAVTDADAASLPRGQPDSGISRRELLFVGIVLLTIMGVIAYGSYKHQKQ